MKFRIFIAISTLIFSANSLFSQDTKVVRDFRFIGKLGITKELFNSWEIGIGSALKLEKDASRIDEIDLDVEVYYQPHPILVLGVGYRYAFNQKKDSTYEQKQRLFGEAELNFKWERFKFEYRLRYQNVDDDFFQYVETAPADHILRNRFKVDYNIPKTKLTPYFYSELYGNLEKGTKFAIKMKFALGLKYSFGKYGNVKLYYRIDRQLNDPYPFIYYSLGIGYNYKF